MIKSAWFDIDGVITELPTFSIEFSKKYGTNIDDIVAFFKNEFQDCLSGNADMSAEMPKYFDKWRYKGNFSELMNFWNSLDKKLKVDYEFLNYVKSYIKSMGIVTVLTTNQEKYRTQSLVENFHFDSYFDYFYPSCNTGYKKPDYDFYNLIFTDLNKVRKIKKDEILFFDDSEKNIKGAREFGIKAEIYPGFEEFKKIVEQQIS